MFYFASFSSAALNAIYFFQGFYLNFLSALLYQKESPFCLRVIKLTLQ